MYIHMCVYKCTRMYICVFLFKSRFDASSSSFAQSISHLNKAIEYKTVPNLRIDLGTCKYSPLVGTEDFFRR